MTKAVDSRTLDTNADVTAKTEAYAKIQEKVKQFYGIKKLKVQARDISKITQGDKSANQLFVEILELWNLSEYGEDNSEEQIKEILLRALKDDEIKLQYELSLLPGRTKLTVEGIVAYANEFALHKKASHYRTNQIQRGGFQGVEALEVEVENGEATQIEEVAQVVTKTIPAEEIEEIKGVKPAIHTLTKQATLSVTPKAKPA